MKSVGGIFASRRDGEHAAGWLRTRGLSADHINLLSPESRGDSAVVTDEGEPPGIGAAVGGVTGGAAGAAGGIAAVTALATGFIPGVGPVIAAGVLGAALAGAAGAAIGNALERAMASGIPKDEWLVYEAALRQGHTVLIAIPEDARQAAAAQEVLSMTAATRGGQVTSRP